MSTEIEDLKAKFRPAAQIAALAFFVLWICLVVYPWISPAGRQARTRLERIKPGQVAEISIIPAGNHPAVDRPLLIDDPIAVAGFETALSRLPTGIFWRNHPNLTRTALLTIRFRDGGQIVGKLEQSSNDGTALVLMSDDDGSGWVYRTYRVPDGRRILDVVDRAVAASAVAASSAPRAQSR